MPKGHFAEPRWAQCASLARRGPRRSSRSPAPGPGRQCLLSAFPQWIHFLDAKHLYLLVLPFEWCLWLVCFELHYRLECNCGGSIFISLRVAANHSYMLQRIYNCLVLCICVLTAFGKFYGEEYAWFKIYNNVTGTFSSILPIFKIVFSLNFSTLTSLFFLAVGRNSLLAPYAFSASRLYFIYCLYTIFLEVICRTNNLEGLFSVE